MKTLLNAWISPPNLTLPYCDVWWTYDTLHSCLQRPNWLCSTTERTEEYNRANLVLVPFSHWRKNAEWNSLTWMHCDCMGCPSSTAILRWLSTHHPYGPWCTKMDPYLSGHHGPTYSTGSHTGINHLSFYERLPLLSCFALALSYKTFPIFFFATHTRITRQRTHWIYWLFLFFEVTGIIIINVLSFLMHLISFSVRNFERNSTCHMRLHLPRSSKSTAHGYRSCGACIVLNIFHSSLVKQDICSMLVLLPIGSLARSSWDSVM